MEIVWIVSSDEMIMRKEIEHIYKMSFLVFLMICTNSVSAGLDNSQPVNLTMNIWDGEVMAVWSHPVKDSSKYQYNVQMGIYGSNWTIVSHCMRIHATYCDLTELIHNYVNAYKVRVQLVTEDGMSKWTTIKKFYPNKSQLQPPSFTLLATSSTLTVKIHEKPILKKLFPYGVTYTIYLEEMGEINKTTEVYLKEDIITTFYSLQWGRKYCVSLKVEGNGALTVSEVSNEHCLLLPEQEWYIMAVISLSTMGVTAVLASLFTAFCCFLKRPEKTPPPLKSPRSDWSPFTVQEGSIEEVRDNAWFMFATEVKNWAAKETASLPTNVQREEAQEDRRTSTDSGVSFDSNAAAKNSRDPARQEDSGFESLGGSECSATCGSGTRESPLQEGRTNSHSSTIKEDSGLGLGSQLDCCRSLGEQESSFLSEQMPVALDNYRRQCTLAVQLRDCEETLKRIDGHTELAEVVTGYRGTQLLCVCSGAGHCVCCQTKGYFGTNKAIKYGNMCIVNDGELSFSNYRKTHIQMETVISMDDSETSPNFPHEQFSEDFPLLTAFSSLPLVEDGLNCSLMPISLSLSDVELITN